MNGAGLGLRTDAKLVMVIQGDAKERASVSELVAELGCRVVEASNAEEAFEFLLLHPKTQVDLIILELELEGLSGSEFLALASSYVRLSKIPVLVLSALMAQLQPRELSALAGSLRAPYEPARLREMVKRLTGCGL